MPALTLAHVGTKLALSAVQPVMSKVGSLITTEIGSFWEVDKKLKELKVTYHETQSKISEFDSWHFNGTNPTLGSLLVDFYRYCYDIEDIVDNLELSFQTNEEDQHQVRSYIMNSFRVKVPYQIAELQKNLQGLHSLIGKLFSTRAINQPQNSGTDIDSESLYYKKPLVDGTSRDKDKHKVISELISQQSKHCGVSIIGMDGLGKTSLARSILLDDNINKKHFHLVLSACVAGHFKMDDVVQKLVRDHSTGTEQQTPLTLEQIVGSKKTLIMLDDVWTVTKEDWDLFKFNNLGSCPDWRILTTTRNPEVAKVTKSELFYLGRMTDKDCEKIIVERAELSESDREDWSNDIEVIAKKCMGFPILANKVGSNLSMAETGAKMKESLIQLKEAPDLEEFTEVFRSLNLDEPKLPPDLKRCFAYCSLFPTSHEFIKDDLIQLWEVEELNQSQQTERRGRGMACHFEDLLSRSILQPITSRDKKQTVFKMHEFNHEFAHLLAYMAICRLEEGTANSFASSKILRHLSLACHNTDETLLKKIEECKRLRTFLLLHHSPPKERVVSKDILHKLNRLRLLNLSHTNISKPTNLEFLSKHLRFLDLSYSSITKLPDSVCTIPALRILKLKGCRNLLKLPGNFHCLTNLTHLHVDTTLKPPSNIGKLTKLEVLDSFSVTKDDCCRVVELRGMKHLNKIHMFGLENIRNMKEAQETMLSERLSLRILVLEWKADTVDNASDVLKGLEPHSHLNDLAVRNYPGENFPEWLVSPSCQLTSFKLDDCPNCEVLPSLSQLKVLTNLEFRSIHKVKTLDDQFCGEAERVYPCLESLEFHDMKRLVRWSGLKSGDMPRLASLKIVKCPMLINLPSFVPLVCLINLEIEHCPKLLSLPDMPPSMNSDSGKLVLIESELVALRCEPEGVDRPKIDKIPYVEIDFIRIITKSSSSSQKNIEGKVSMDEPESSMLMNGNSATKQTRANESRSNNSKGKQKIEFISNSYICDCLDMEPTNIAQLTSSSPQSTSSAATDIVTRANESRAYNSKGKQKVDEGSSSNQVEVAQSPPGNEITEQPEDMEPRSEGQLTLASLQSTPTAAATDVVVPPKHSKRRLSRFFRMFSCGSE